MKKKSRINKFRGKRVGLSILKVLEVILKNVYYLIVGIVSFIITIYLATERAFLKGFKKSPKTLNSMGISLILLPFYHVQCKL